LDRYSWEGLTYTTRIKDPQHGGMCNGTVWRTGVGIPRR
jgi:hypothetical protein